MLREVGKYANKVPCEASAKTYKLKYFQNLENRIYFWQIRLNFSKTASFALLTRRTWVFVANVPIYLRVSKDRVSNTLPSIVFYTTAATMLTYISSPFPERSSFQRSTKPCRAKLPGRLLLPLHTLIETRSFLPFRLEDLSILH